MSQLYKKANQIHTILFNEKTVPDIGKCKFILAGIFMLIMGLPGPGYFIFAISIPKDALCELKKNKKNYSTRKTHLQFSVMLACLCLLIIVSWIIMWIIFPLYLAITLFLFGVLSLLSILLAIDFFMLSCGPSMSFEEITGKDVEMNSNKK